jgi:hypothetical protein
MSVLPELTLPQGDYPFIDQRYPLAELAMIEVPENLQRLLIEQAEKNGEEIVRDVAVELRCISEQFGDATFLIYWPHGYRMHMLAPSNFRRGNA